VAWLQASLNKLMAAGIVVDGNYGRQTRNAVIAFQQGHRLEPDGLAGPLTIAALPAS
jgi:peptidoglycan hydrolase-like protein with peptidoglycan-binding domain